MDKTTRFLARLNSDQKKLLQRYQDICTQLNLTVIYSVYEALALRDRYRFIIFVTDCRIYVLCDNVEQFDMFLNTEIRRDDVEIEPRQRYRLIPEQSPQYPWFIYYDHQDKKKTAKRISNIFMCAVEMKEYNNRILYNVKREYSDAAEYNRKMNEFQASERGSFQQPIWNEIPCVKTLDYDGDVVMYHEYLIPRNVISVKTIDVTGKKKRKELRSWVLLNPPDNIVCSEYSNMCREALGEVRPAKLAKIICETHYQRRVDGRVVWVFKTPAGEI
jgi:hypothetical protein